MRGSSLTVVTEPEGETKKEGEKWRLSRSRDVSDLNTRFGPLGCRRHISIVSGIVYLFWDEDLVR